MAKKRAAKARGESPPRLRPSVVSLDLLGLHETIDEELEKARRLDPGATRATVIRTLLVEALRAKGAWK